MVSTTISLKIRADVSALIPNPLSAHNNLASECAMYFTAFPINTVLWGCFSSHPILAALLIMSVQLQSHGMREWPVIWLMWQLSHRQEVTEKSFTLFFIIFLDLLQQNTHATNWKMREKNYFVLKSQTMQLSYRKTGWHLHLEGKTFESNRTASGN